VGPEERKLENGRSEWLPTEQTSLLTPQRQRHESVVDITFFPSKPKFTTVKRRPIYIPHPHWADLSPRLQWWLLILYNFLNAPLLGAVLGVIIGLTPPLHRAFFNNTYDGGIFAAWLTESWKNVGSLFVPPLLIVAGISLYATWQNAKDNNTSDASDGWRTTTIPKAMTVFILLVRFGLWPVLSIGTIFLITRNTGRRGFLSKNPVLRFAMMLMPPAMKLITMVQVNDAGLGDERRIAGILTISYVVSPFMAFIVVGALRASQAAI
jgi:hypothetical protein